MSGTSLKKPKKNQQRNKDKEGKKRPLQDDSALILAVAVILVVGYAYVMTSVQNSNQPRKIIIKAQTDDVERTVNQDLSLQRQNIEEHIKKFLALPEGAPDNPLIIARQGFFNPQGWEGYQRYLAERQGTIPAGQQLKAEFVYGSQKYAVLGDDLTAFRANGTFCFGGDKDYKCGPQRFVMEAILRGSINSPDALIFEDWKIMPPPVAGEVKAATP